MEKPTASTTASNAANNDDDDLANEIMQELNSKASKTKPALPNRAPKPMMQAPRPAFSQIPFALNTNISLSPAHKRKLSPSASSSSDKCSTESRSCKKIELDDDLVQQLFDSDSQPFDFSNANQTPMVVKSEPIEHAEESVNVKPAFSSNVSIKKEKSDEFLNDEDREALENIELLSQLTLEASNSSMLAKQLNLPVKPELSTTMDFNALNTTTDDIDIQMHLKNSAHTDKFLFYLLDAYEDQFNSNGTIYLFGKTPIAKQSESADQPLSYVSVCCVVKNVPKVFYVLPRRFKLNKAKIETNEPVNMELVGKEIDSIMLKNKINNYRTRVVKKFFAFDRRSASKTDPVDIPYEAEYLQVEYTLGAHDNNKQIPADLQGECFSCILSTQGTYIEQFLIDSKIKGPSWLQVANAKQKESFGAMMSWCKLEYTVENYRTITPYHEGVTLANPPGLGNDIF